jgi:hypothetical protein
MCQCFFRKWANKRKNLSLAREPAIFEGLFEDRGAWTWVHDLRCFLTSAPACAKAPSSKDSGQSPSFLPKRMLFQRDGTLGLAFRPNTPSLVLAQSSKIRAARRKKTNTKKSKMRTTPTYWDAEGSNRERTPKHGSAQTVIFRIEPEKTEFAQSFFWPTLSCCGEK